MQKISSIPERYEMGLKKMSSIDELTFSAIQEGLSYTSLVSSLTILSEKVAKIKNLDFNTVRDIFFSAGSLTTFLDKDAVISNMVEEVAALVEERKIVEPDKLDNLKERLSFLLQSQQIYFAAKANRLMSENGNVYIQSRIVTDLRPVFSINVEEAPKAGIIIHNLHIHYQSDAEGTHKDFFISLDSRDIKILKESLNRAEKKENSLQLLYNKIGMTNLNEPDERL